MNPSIDAAAVAVVVVRDGRLPAGAEDAVAEAGGNVLLAGTGLEEAASALLSSARTWLVDTGPLGPGTTAARLAGLMSDVELVILPASADGRDLAPRLAAELGRPLLACAVECSVHPGGVTALLLRADGQVVVPATCHGPAVATLLPGVRGPAPTPEPLRTAPVTLAEHGAPAGDSADVGDSADGDHGVAGTVPHLRDADVLAVVEPDPATMDLADATRVVGGGAGLVGREASPAQAQSVFALLSDVAAALGASAGATRVVTDAGWMSYDRQIGTTGVAVNPDLYIALGVSGASQHVGGIGSPRVTVSVNSDPACPMTSMADLGLVTDAPSFLVELSRRLGVEVPSALSEKRPTADVVGDGR